jgi:hypothetical protein
MALALALCGACGSGEAVPPPTTPASAAVSPAPPPGPEPTRPGLRRVTLRYAAPIECPDASGYLSEVRSRSTTLDVEPEGEATAAPDGVDVHVSPEPSSGGWLGQVSIEGELALERVVRGERCEDVVAALAVITVLRFEGRVGDGPAETASTAPASSASSSSSPATGARGTESTESSGSEATRAPAAPAVPPAVAVPPAASTRSASTAESPPAVPEPSLAPTEPPPAESPEEPPRTSPPAESSATDLDAVAPLAPDVGVTARPSSEPGSRVADTSSEAQQQADAQRDADARSEADAQSASASWVWPEMATGLALRGGYASAPDHAFEAELETELRFGASMSSWAVLASVAFARGGAQTALAQSSLSLWTGQLGLCAPAFLDQPSVWLRACLNGRAGALRLGIEPRDSSLLRFDAPSAWGPWLSVVPALQVGVPLTEHWSLRGVLELAIQLLRNRFEVSGSDIEGEPLPPYTVYRPEPVSFEVGLGVGYAF